MSVNLLAGVGRIVCLGVRQLSHNNIIQLADICQLTS